jgi:hypothetical protein
MQEYPLPEIKAAVRYFLDTGQDFWDLTPTEQKRKIEEELR